jgi:phosphoribosylformylglycinamidine synthase subunit PurL
MTTLDHTAITADVIAEHGLSGAEYAKILGILGRPPNITELGIFSVMWSEHCSYKSSKRWLKTLPTEAPWVICGPGENAGIVDIGDGQAVIFKMESHNHPSYIEPYQGAATGVGGILRDVFTMGARPIASLNALRFGSTDHPKTRHLVSGVVAGIGGYGNCVGVPTVGGECTFDRRYDGNILVNAMAVGLVAADRIFYSAAAGIGNPVVYVGSRTGRDGIHGATMASAEFSDDTEEKRPTVQVGDPFTEKLLIEACLELMATDAIIAIQDMGAAGLTSSSFEMASKGGLGIALDLDRVPIREAGMTAYEIMLSESQERMLMVLKPGREAEAEAVFRKWELDFAISSARPPAAAAWSSATAALWWSTCRSIPSPRPRRTMTGRGWPPPAAPLDLQSVPAPADLMAALVRLLACPDLASKRWIWEQYDHMVMADTVQRPGGDAAVSASTAPARASLWLATARRATASPIRSRAAVRRWWKHGAISPRSGQDRSPSPTVSTSAIPRSRRSWGSSPAASPAWPRPAPRSTIPSSPATCRFYNETNGVAIPPTPTIGGVGLIDRLDRTASPDLKAPGQVLMLIGGPTTTCRLARTIALLAGNRGTRGWGAAAGRSCRRAPHRRLRARTDCRRPGLAPATTSPTAGSGRPCRNGHCRQPRRRRRCSGRAGPLHAWLFGEDQGRYLLAIEADAVETVAGRRDAGVSPGPSAAPAAIG